MKYLKRLVAVTSLIITLSFACTKASKSSQTTPDGGPGLLGTDSDHNGIRDDIDDYIKKRFPDSQKKRAALAQLAKAYQDAFRVIDKPMELISGLDKIARADICLNAIFGHPGVTEGDALEAEVFSNFERSNVGMKIESLLFLNFGSRNWPEHSVRIKECYFDITKMEN